MVRTFLRSLGGSYGEKPADAMYRRQPLRGPTCGLRRRKVEMVIRAGQISGEAVQPRRRSALRENATDTAVEWGAQLGGVEEATTAVAGAPDGNRRGGIKIVGAIRLRNRLGAAPGCAGRLANENLAFAQIFSLLQGQMLQLPGKMESPEPDANKAHPTRYETPAGKYERKEGKWKLAEGASQGTAYGVGPMLLADGRPAPKRVQLRATHFKENATDTTQQIGRTPRWIA